MSIAWAFVRRDWFRQTSYRMFFVGQVIQLIALVGVVYLIGSAVAGIAGFKVGLEYVRFLLVGIACADVFTACVQAGPSTLRDAQVTGTLETMMLAPIRAIHLIFASTLFPIIRAMIRAAIVLSVGAIVFRFWPGADVLGVALIVVPAYLSFAAVSLIGAAYVLAFKQGDPVTGIFMAVNGIIGGAVIPVSALPWLLQQVSNVLPLTHAVAGVRDALAGATPPDLAPQILALWVSAAVLIPVAAAAFRICLHIARKDGSLVHY